MTNIEAMMIAFICTGLVGSILYGHFNGESQIIRLLSYFSIFSFFYSNSKEKGLLESKRLALLLVIPFFIISTASGLYSITYHTGLEINRAFRIVGNIGSPVGYSIVIFISSIAIFLLKKDISYFFIAAILVISLYLIYSTATRSIIASSIFITFITLAFKDGLSLKRIITISFLIIVVIVSIIHYGAINHASILERFEGLLSGEISSDSSTSFRLMLIMSTFDNYDVFNLLFGYGIGNFPLFFYQTTGIDNVAPHLEIVWLLFEYGILGFLCYVSMLIFIYRRVSTNYKSGMFTFLEYTLIIFLIVSHMLFLQFANPFYFYQFGIIYFALLGTYSGASAKPYIILRTIS